MGLKERWTDEEREKTVDALMGLCFRIQLPEVNLEQMSTQDHDTEMTVAIACADDILSMFDAAIEAEAFEQLPLELPDVTLGLFVQMWLAGYVLGSEEYKSFLILALRDRTRHSVIASDEEFKAPLTIRQGGEWDIQFLPSLDQKSIRIRAFKPRESAEEEPPPSPPDAA